MSRRLVLPGLLLGWVLLAARRDGKWQTVGDFPGSYSCNEVRAQRVADDANRQIGTALANLPGDNPMRQQAFARAADRARDQYRCEWQSGR